MDVGIIGGGASGVMAAITARRNKNNVTLLEHNSKPLKKILSTGNGKCNFTNKTVDELFYGEGQRELFNSVYSKFDLKKTLEFFDEIGIVAYEKNGYFYPNSEQAKSVYDCLSRELLRNDIEVICDINITEIIKKDKFNVIFNDGNILTFDKLIIAAGSNAMPSSGSDGSGYGLAIKLNHTVKKPLPALCGLKCEGNEHKILSGVRCRARVSLFVNDLKVMSDEGELQHTDYGISGIPVFQISSMALRELDNKAKVKVIVDYMPAYSVEKLREMIDSRFESLSDTCVSTFLDGMFNSKLCEYILKKTCYEPYFNNMVSSLNKDKFIDTLINTVKNCEYIIKGHRGFDNCQVCSGGVVLDEVKDTLESKLVDGLYFTGEILDVDGKCGGYNLQWAWSSGFVAGLLE